MANRVILSGPQAAVVVIGGPGTGGGPQTVATIQAVVDAFVAADTGGNIQLLQGEWTFPVALDIPPAAHDISIYGTGADTILKRTASTAVGKGLIDVYGKGITFRNLAIDGGVTTSVGVDVATISDPAAANLVLNSSIWVHEGAERFLIQGVTVMHTGGYAVLLDSRSGNIYDAQVLDCTFANNRPHKFGPAGNMIYGSWTGGILLKNDGVSYGVKGITVSRCRWSRVTGNCLWGHGNALGSFNESITLTDNVFEDFGLDGIEVGSMVGGIVSGNKFRRGGFLHSTDSDTPSPLTNPTVYSVALDSTGYVQGVSIDGNTVTNQNGGACDLDGFLDGSVTNNVFANAFPGDPTYSQDQVGGFGPTKGLQTGNSFYRYAGRNIVIANNTIINFNTNALSLKNAKYCRISGNKIFHPSTAAEIPVKIFCIRGEGQSYSSWLSDSTDYRSYGNSISGNTISYSGGNYIIAEIEYNDGTNVYPFDPSDENRIFDNHNPVSNVYGEWLKAASSASIAGFRLPTNDDTAAGLSENRFQREGIGVSAALKIYGTDGATTNQVMQISDSSFVNVSVAGAPGTGYVATGDRSTLGWPDSIATGKLLADGIFVMGAGTYADADADILDSHWGLLRWNDTLHRFQQSISVATGHRVWTDLAGTMAPPGATTQVVFNDAGVLGASSAFTFNKTTKVLTVTGVTATASILAAVGYIQSQDGFYTPLARFDSYQTLGGVFGRSVTLNEVSAVGGYVNIAPLAGASPAVTTGDSFTGNAQIWLDNNHLLKHRVTGGIFGFDAPAGEGAVAVTLGSGMTGNRLAAINFLTDATFTDYGMRLLRGANANADGLLANAGVGTLRLWSGSGTLTFATGTTGVSTPTDRMTLGATGILSLGGTNTQLDQAGNISAVGVISAEGASGFVGIPVNTSKQAFQAPAGGITVKYMVMTQSFEATAVLASGVAVSGAHQFKMIFDSATDKLLYSENGSSFVACFGAGSSSVAGINRQIQFNNSGTFGASTGLTWNDTTKQQAITGLTGTAGLTVLASYIQSDEGFATASTSPDAVSVPLGGIKGLSLITLESIYAVGVSAPANSALHQGKLHYNLTAEKFQYSENGSSWANCFGAGSTVAGANTEVQFNNALSFGASPNFTWTNGSKLLTVTGATGTAGITVVSSYIQSAEGFYSTSTSATAINVPTGGATLGGITLVRSASVARTYSLGISTAGAFELNDVTGSNTRISIAPGGTITVPGLSGGDQVIFITAPSTFGSYLEFGPSGLWVEYQGSPIGDWMVGHYGIAAGVFKSTRSGAVANTLVLNAGRATVLGIAANPGLILTNGYMSSSEGYFTNHTGYQAVNASAGGVYAKSLHSLNYIDPGQSSGAGPAATSGASFRAGNLYWDTGTAFYKYYNGSAWIAFPSGSGSAAGSNTQIQYNNSGAFGASANFTYNSGTGTLVVSGPTNTNILSYVTATGIGNAFFLLSTAGGAVELQATNLGGDFYLNHNGISSGVFRSIRSGSLASTLVMSAGSVTILKQLVVGGSPGGQGILVSSGYVQSSEGFLTNSTAFNAINAPSGGMLSKIYYASQTASGHTTMVRLENLQAGVNGAAVEFRSTDTISSGASYNAGRIYGVFDSNIYSTARVTIQTPTGVGTFTDVLTCKGSRVGVMNLSPGYTLDVTGEGHFSGQVVIGGAASGAGLTIVDGYLESAEGFYSPMANYQAVNLPNGGAYMRSLHALIYSQVGQNSGAPSATSGAAMGDGAVYYDTSTAKLRVRISGTFVDVSTGAGGGGVTSLTAGTGISLSGSTGAVTVSLNSSATVTFANVTATGVVQASGSTTFQNTNFRFSVTSNGDLSMLGAINCSGYATIGGVVTCAGVNAGSSGITCGGYGVSGFFGGSSSYSGTITDNLGTVWHVRGGILTTA